jgi:hypothetical protein
MLVADEKREDLGGEVWEQCGCMLYGSVSPYGETRY